MAPSFLLFVFILLIDLASASPSITLPINAQVPPVARVQQLFTFTFSASSFTSPFESILYSLAGAPAWLHFDGPTRTFSGTPTSHDVGSCSFNLVAADQAGATFMEVTLVVTESSGPAVGMPLASRLSQVGAFSSPETLIVKPGSPIFLAFGQQTFNNTNVDTGYYAISADNTPLPSWLHFDPDRLAITGITPPFNSPSALPQNIPIILSASNVPGFSDATAIFHLYVSNHQLSFGAEPLVVNATPGQELRYDGIRAALGLDGKPVEPPILKSVTANCPEWMNLDNKSLLLYGTPPDGVTSGSFGISVEDDFGDVANTTVFVSVDTSSELIKEAIGPLNASIGGPLKYVMAHDITSSPSAVVSMDLEASSAWLIFDAKSRTLSGTVPDSIEPQIVTLNLTIKDGLLAASQVIRLKILPRDSDIAAPTTVQATSTTIPSLPPSTSQSSVIIPIDTSNDRRRIAAEVLLPLVGVAGLAVVLWLWWRRHKQRGSRDDNVNWEKPRIARLPLPPPSPDSELTIRRHRRSFVPRLELFTSSAGDMTNLKQSPDGLSEPRLRTADRSSKHDSIVNFIHRAISPINFDSATKRASSQQPETCMPRSARQSLARSILQPTAQNYRALGENPFIPTLEHSRSNPWKSCHGRSFSSFPDSPFRGRGHGAVISELPSLSAAPGNPKASFLPCPLLDSDAGTGAFTQTSRPSGTPINFSKLTAPRSESRSASSKRGVGLEAPVRSIQPEPTIDSTNMAEALNAMPTIRRVATSPSPSSASHSLSVPRKRPSIRSGSLSSKYSRPGRASHDSSQSSAPPPPLRNPRRAMGPRGERNTSSGGFTGSNRASAARKGAMMQQSALFSEAGAGSRPRYSPWPSSSRAFSGGGGRPPRLSHFQSRSSVGSSKRYEDAAEDDSERRSRSTGRSGAAHEGEDLVLAELAGGEEGARRWERSESPSAIMAYGAGAGAWRVKTSANEGSQGVVKKEHADIKAVLGDMGRREVSVSPGLRGSKSFEGEMAFL